MNYHDLLARLGEGSAHPGGFEATRRLLKRIRIPPGSKVLEVGCGTGRTACMLAQQGLDVTAVDVHPGMLDKARRRARLTGSPVRFVAGDATSLPFSDQAFDVVFAESVTVFTRGDGAFREYRRVLKPGGRLWDREMALSGGRSSVRSCRDLAAFYGIRHLMSPRQWTDWLRSSGFRRIRISVARPRIDLYGDADPVREWDPSLLQDEEALRLLRRNAELLAKYRGRILSVLMTAVK
jgi:SAM-dependent methyltransferase